MVNIEEVGVVCVFKMEKKLVCICRVVLVLG